MLPKLVAMKSKTSGVRFESKESYISVNTPINTEIKTALNGSVKNIGDQINYYTSNIM